MGLALAGAALGAALLVAFPSPASGVSGPAALALSLAGVLGGFLRPRASTLALAFSAPLLQGLPRLWGDPSEPPFLAAVASSAALGALAGFARRDGALARPGGAGAWGLGFLVVASASAAASAVRGETVYLLLRGGAAPHTVNALGMTASGRTAAALATFGALVVLLAGGTAFAAACRTERGSEDLVTALALGVITAGLPLLAERLSGVPVTASRWRQIGRASGLASDPNALGIGMALAAILLAGLSAATPGWRRKFAVTGAAVALGALQLSGSRTGLLLAVTAGLTAAWGWSTGSAARRHQVAVAVAVALASVGGLAVAAPRGGPTAEGNLFARIGASLTAPSLDALASHRPLFWREALALVAEAPLGGCGLGGFPFELPVRTARRGLALPATDGTTNGVLEVAAECGLAALGLALAGAAPLVRVAGRGALSRSSGPLPRAAGSATLAFCAASVTGAHARFADVALVAALAAALAIARHPIPEPVRAGSRRLRPALVALGLGGAALVPLASVDAGAAFPVGPWTGAHAAEGERRWLGPRAHRRVLPGEGPVGFCLQNARPDGRPVRVTIESGRTVSSLSLAAGTRRRIAVPVSPGTASISLSFEPVFVPRLLTGRPDDRQLSVLLLDEADELAPRSTARPGAAPRLQASGPSDPGAGGSSEQGP